MKDVNLLKNDTKVVLWPLHAVAHTQSYMHRNMNTHTPFEGGREGQKEGGRGRGTEGGRDRELWGSFFPLNSGWDQTGEAVLSNLKYINIES